MRTTYIKGYCRLSVRLRWKSVVSVLNYAQTVTFLTLFLFSQDFYILNQNFMYYLIKPCKMWCNSKFSKSPLGKVKKYRAIWKSFSGLYQFLNSIRVLKTPLWVVGLMLVTLPLSHFDNSTNYCAQADSVTSVISYYSITHKW